MNIRHLGEVNRLYIEANGKFTLIKNGEARPGLSVLPGWDKDFAQEVQRSTGTIVCNNCGNYKENNKSTDHTCSNCSNTEWVSAVL